MKSILFISIMVCIFFPCASQNFISISKQVEKKCIGKSNWKGQSFHDLRTRLYNEGRLGFVSSDFDTLYILESYEIESGSYTGKIWNRKGDLNYIYNKNSFQFDQQKLFTDYTIQLIQRWDTATVRTEESLNTKSISEKYITGIKVIMENQKIRIDCIKFKEFFNLERDR